MAYNITLACFYLVNFVFGIAVGFITSWLKEKVSNEEISGVKAATIAIVILAIAIALLIALVVVSILYSIHLFKIRNNNENIYLQDSKIKENALYGGILVVTATVVFAALRFVPFPSGFDSFKLIIMCFALGACGIKTMPLIQKMRGIITKEKYYPSNHEQEIQESQETNDQPQSK